MRGLLLLLVLGATAARADEVVEGPPVTSVLMELTGRHVLVATPGGGFFEGTLVTWDDDALVILTPEGREARLARGQVLSVRGTIPDPLTAPPSAPLPAPAAPRAPATGGAPDAEALPTAPAAPPPAPVQVTELPAAPAPVPPPADAPEAPRVVPMPLPSGRIERLADETWRVGGQPVQGWEVEEILLQDTRAQPHLRRARTKTLAGLASAGGGALLTFGGMFLAAGEARGDLFPAAGVATMLTGVAVSLGAGIPLLWSARQDRIAAVEATGGVVMRPDGGLDVKLAVTF